MMLGDTQLASIKSLDDSVREGYRVLTQGCGLVNGQSLTFIEVTGRDRARFIHNLCTNDILRLTPGSGCEAFVTNVQGKTIGHGLIFCLEESLVLISVPGQQEKLIAHWDRYLITEDVQLYDRSSVWQSWLVAGPQLDEVLATFLGSAAASVQQFKDQATLNTVAVEAAGTALRFFRVPWLGSAAWLIVSDATSSDSVAAAMQAAGAPVASAASFHLARIDAGYPWFGWDITDKNLSQEVNRTEQAISFRKGCYLGQETVARLDALGHVNRLLTQMETSDSQVPAAGDVLLSDGQSVGEVTSAGLSPANDRGHVLGYVRCTTRDAGKPLMTASGIALAMVLPSAS